jgi:FMN phosphatase YigB (HAD superfamily)
MKQALLLALAILSLNCSEKTAPKKLILFDWHGVVVHQSTKKAIKAFFKLKNKFSFVKNLINQDKNKSIGFNTNQRQDESIYPVLNCHDLDPEMAQVIKKLKAQGYKIGIFSNIDADSLKWAAKKDKKIKEIVDLMDFTYVADAKNNFKTKNSPETFKECKKMIKESLGNDTDIIFIDDSKKNVEQGQKQGFKTHHYESIKKFKEYIVKLLKTKI